MSGSKRSKINYTKMCVKFFSFGAFLVQIIEIKMKLIVSFVQRGLNDSTKLFSSFFYIFCSLSLSSPAPLSHVHKFLRNE